ncbi:MAG: putative lipid II flippase FtsW [Candidatus Omnitrophota bacterium]
MKNDAKMVLLLTSLILMVGVVMIYSSSSVYAYQRYGDSMHLIKRHFLFLCIGFVSAIFFLKIHYRDLARSSKMILALFIVLLLLLLVPGVGVEAGGARRWMRIFGIGFQPSEGIKIAIIIYLADFASRKRYLMGDLVKGFIPPVSLILLSSGLILLQPDMGTSISVLFIGFVLLFISGVKLRHIAGTIVPVIPIMAAAIIWKPYRLRRIAVFLDPWRDSSGAGFQLVQSFIALGSGGVTGVGLGQSKQKLFYLPEAHTDFIFSIIGEELGFLGSVSLVAFFAALIFFIFRIGMRMNERFSSLVVMGIGVMVAFEVLVNMGVSTGLLPTKGLPLPFVSYGGSSLFFHLIAIAIVLNFSRQCEERV